MGPDGVDPIHPIAWQQLPDQVLGAARMPSPVIAEDDEPRPVGERFHEKL